MAALLRCVLAFALIACVLGHAVLIDPTPLNTNPTTANPCGVSSYPSNPAPSVSWTPGQQVTITWKLIATDGGTSVTGEYTADGTKAITGSSSFPNPLFTGSMNNGLNTYQYTFNAPTSACNGVCMMRVFTETGWNSCTYFNITCAGCPAPPPPAPKCENPNNGQLTFCDGYFDNTNVLVPYDSSVAALDANAKAAYNSYINNTNVFENGNNATCQATFHEFICKQTLVPCPGAGQNFSTLANCHATCEQMSAVCQTNPKHSELYPCADRTQFPLCYGESGAGIVTASLLFVAALFVALF